LVEHPFGLNIGSGGSKENIKDLIAVALQNGFSISSELLNGVYAYSVRNDLTNFKTGKGGPTIDEYGVTTAFHKPYVQKYLDMFAPYFKDVIVLKASEGSPEVFKDGKYWKMVDKNIIEESFSLKDYGIVYDREFENISLEEALNIVKNPDENILKLAKFNVALYLFFANRVSSLDEAWQRLN
jgi:hypothetical protein